MPLDERPCEAGPTPRRIRLAAAVWLVGAMTVGGAAVVSRPFRWAVFAGVGASATWAGLVIAAARTTGSDGGGRVPAAPPRDRVPPPRDPVAPPHDRGAPPNDPVAPASDHIAPASDPVAPGRDDRPASATPAHRASDPLLSVVVAARDEVEVLPSLLADLAEQNIRCADGTPQFEVVLIDDRSTDGTFEAMVAGARDPSLLLSGIVRRPAGATGGKGAALRSVPPAALRGQAIVVLDADARVDPSFLALVAAHTSAGRAALTARRRIAGAERSAWARVQDDEQTVDALVQLGRDRIGGCAEFRGDGMVVRRDLLASLGGWAVDALTEDLDLSSRLAAVGVRVAVPPELVLREMPVRGLRPFWYQRMRWAEGSIRRYLRHTVAVARSPALPPRARLDFVVYACQLALPPLLLGAALAGVARRRPLVPLTLVAGYAAGGVALSYSALRAGGRADDSTRPMVRRAIAVTLFGATWLVVVPAAFVRLAVRRGPAVHARTPHRPVPVSRAGHRRAGPGLPVGGG
jgi:1,2-diacylglycerol 3-beta-glucosyltransferase